jgi:hypothetical protein
MLARPLPLAQAIVLVAALVRTLQLDPPNAVSARKESTPLLGMKVVPTVLLASTTLPQAVVSVVLATMAMYLRPGLQSVLHAVVASIAQVYPLARLALLASTAEVVPRLPVLIVLQDQLLQLERLLVPSVPQDTTRHPMPLAALAVALASTHTRV